MGRPGDGIQSRPTRAVAGRAGNRPTEGAGNVNYLIGTDEAGYGPPLGPLVVAATVWELPTTTPSPSDVDLYDRLRHCVCRRADTRRKTPPRRVAIRRLEGALQSRPQGIGAAGARRAGGLTTLDQQPDHLARGVGRPLPARDRRRRGSLARRLRSRACRLPPRRKKSIAWPAKMRNGFARGRHSLARRGRARCLSRAVQRPGRSATAIRATPFRRSRSDLFPR